MHTLKQMRKIEQADEPDAGPAIEADEQRRSGVPLRRRHRKATLSQVPVKHPAGNPRQHDLAGLAAFANTCSQ